MTRYRIAATIGVLAALALLALAGQVQASMPLTMASAKQRIHSYDSRTTIKSCRRWTPMRIVCHVISWNPINREIINPETGETEAVEEGVAYLPVPLWADVENGARVRFSFEAPKRSASATGR